MKHDKRRHYDVDEFERKARKNKKNRRQEQVEDDFEKYTGKIDPNGFLDEEEELWDDLERNDRR